MARALCAKLKSVELKVICPFYKSSTDFPKLQVLARSVEGLAFRMGEGENTYPEQVCPQRHGYAGCAQPPYSVRPQVRKVREGGAGR